MIRVRKATVVVNFLIAVYDVDQVVHQGTGLLYKHIFYCAISFRFRDNLQNGTASEPDFPYPAALRTRLRLGGMPQLRVLIRVRSWPPYIADDSAQPGSDSKCTAYDQADFGQYFLWFP